MSDEDRRRAWDGMAGRRDQPDQRDAEALALQPWLRSAAAIAPGERVLDIGCGTGETTREAARAAAPGRVLGVDLSAGMLERARELTAAEGLANVAYEQGDAQLYRFEAGAFDVALSRFGVMFFADPAAAFGNIRTALRAGGRLALMVWQSRERNEWARVIRNALVGDGPAIPVLSTPPMGFDPFSLADPATVTGLLEAAGFAAVDLADVSEPVHYGRDADEAYGFVDGLWSIRAALGGMAPGEAVDARRRLRAAMAAHDTGRGVFFGSRVWVVTAVAG